MVENCIKSFNIILMKFHCFYCHCYITCCCEKVVIDKDDVAKGLHELVTHYNIAKLVVGAAVDEYYSKYVSQSCMPHSVCLCC